MMKKVISIICALTLCLSMGGAFAVEEAISADEFAGVEAQPEAVSQDAEAASDPAQDAEQRVFDLAGLFMETERQQLEERIAEVRQSIRPYDVAILTADEGVYDTQDYADRFYEDHGIGTDENRSGVLFFLDMQNRTVWISTAGDLIGIIDDNREEKIFRAQDPYLGISDWASAMLIAVDMTEKFVEAGVAEGTFVYDEATGEALEDSSQYVDLHDSEYYRRQAIEGTIMYVVCGLVFGAIAGLITRAVIKSQYSKKYKEVKYDWRSKSALALTANQSTITNKFVTTRVIPRSNNNNNSGGGFSGGSGSGIHVSSGGMTHGGGGHRF